MNRQGRGSGARRRFAAMGVVVVLTLALSRWTGVRAVTLPSERTGDQVLAEALAPEMPGYRVASIASWTGDGEIRYAGFGADAATGFEIGSLTKTFTGGLLMDAVERGEVTLGTTVGELLGERAAGAPVAAVTLRELASRTSGLPNGPVDARALLGSFLRIDPFGADPERVIELALADPLGTRGEALHSNVGLALLGHVLAQRAGMSYPELLRVRLLQPLGLSASYVPAPGEGMRMGEVVPVTVTGQLASPFTNDGFAPAGMIRSTAADMASWTRAVQSGAHAGARGLEPLTAPQQLPFRDVSGAGPSAGW